MDYVPLEIAGRKNLEIPVLESYSGKAKEDFWGNFPKNPLPTEASTQVNSNELEKLIEESKDRLLLHQYERGLKVVKSLREGASACQKDPPLGSVLVKNAPKCYEYGETMTDNIATWVKKGFAAGPFSCPPTKMFRCNSFLAVKQGEKVRPVLNVSLPEENSFNSNICLNEMEKVTMCSARQFSQVLQEAGEGAVFCKFDQKDAYKNIPAKVEDYRLQGFEWLGKYFVETRQIFGARTAVANYDILGRIILDLAIIDSGVPSKLCMRQLDDVPMVSPVGKDYCDRFQSSYKKICEKVNIELASPCKEFDKAFEKTTYGKVLGIWFRSTDQKWSLPDEKRFKAAETVRKALEQDKIMLLDMQRLMGRLNNIVTMCPFLKLFTSPLYQSLGWLQKNPFKPVILSEECKNDLQVFCGFLSDKDVWHPIAPRPCAPPTVRLNFISDAAGENDSTKGEIGFASVGFDLDGKFLFARQVMWPKGILNEVKDKNGKSYGQKMTTLETLGLLLPLISIPGELRNQNIVMGVDNLGCVYAMDSCKSSNDETASILVRAIHLIAAFLGSRIHAIHVPRMSTWEAELVDRMSRENTTTTSDRALLNSFNHDPLPGCLTGWMENPREDWSLPIELLEYVEKVLNK